MRRGAALTLIAWAATLTLITGCSVGTPQHSDPDGFVFATGEPDHLTPGRQTVAYDQMRALFSPLVSVDDDGTVHGVAAKSVTSDDNVTWTITLRDGWTFQNGEPVTAESYVKAWNHVAYGPNAWEDSGQLAGITGYADLNPESGKPATKTMSGLRVTGKNTFTVTLTGADSSFPLQLTSSQTAFFPMPEAAYEDLDAYDRKPIGNGPYAMTGAWKPGGEFTVQAWSGYQGEKPRTRRVTFRSYQDQNTAYTDVLSGSADVLTLPPEKMTSASADFGDRLHTYDAAGIDYLGFPLWDERYDDPRVREAISMAIDRDAVNRAFFGGLYEPATSLTPPSMIGAKEGVCGKHCEFHPEDAKKLLDEAGGFDGTITLVYPGGAGLDALYQGYANQIRQNLGVETVAKPTTDFASFNTELVEKTVDGPHFGHWGALYPSQQGTLRALLTPTGGCAPCTGYYQDDDVDALLARASAAGDEDEAADYYAEVQDAAFEDFPVVPTFFDKYSYVTSEKITDLPDVRGDVAIAEVTVR
ncbi:ABC transporter substrate-binding protein [Brachybacterium sp. ACRRE]|uniref:peptide ABC transporter substrate-binding protein n=1 Tax=Brachybacterium sp. ACRRE TaxID=2918184 RepID=UPI001EF25B87|nr:ABC transporter substrate-binding protein [Brachybacterium sp. ACRRE]MCG7310752.1 ABC transporter substrate-binding protein [Brachybacterium sp. ACRRE]